MDGCVGLLSCVAFLYVWRILTNLRVLKFRQMDFEALLISLLFGMRHIDKDSKKREKTSVTVNPQQRPQNGFWFIAFAVHGSLGGACDSHDSSVSRRDFLKSLIQGRMNDNHDNVNVSGILLFNTLSAIENERRGRRRRDERRKGNRRIG